MKHLLAMLAVRIECLILTVLTCEHPLSRSSVPYICRLSTVTIQRSHTQQTLGSSNCLTHIDLFAWSIAHLPFDIVVYPYIFRLGIFKSASYHLQLHEFSMSIRRRHFSLLSTMTRFVNR